MNGDQIAGRALYQTGVITGAARALRAAEQAVADGGSIPEVLNALSVLVVVEEGVGWNLDLLDKPSN